MLDQLGAEGSHGCVLVRAVSFRDDDRDVDAGSSAGKSQALTVVATRGRNDPFDLRPLGAQPLGVDETPANLERARGRVILVLHPHLGSDFASEQRPHVLRGGRDPPCDDLCRPGQLFGIERHRINSAIARGAESRRSQGPSNFELQDFGRFEFRRPQAISPTADSADRKR